MTAPSASEQENFALPTAKLTVYFNSEHNALALPFAASELGAKVPASELFALSDTKRPESIYRRDEKAIIEHILVANNFAYNVKKITLEKRVAECDFIYSVTITKAQQGDIPLVIGDTLIINRKNAEGLDALTLVSKHHPHNYQHLPYGMRPDSTDALRALHKKLF